jgi:hypothetical protein
MEFEDEFSLAAFLFESEEQDGPFSSPPAFNDAPATADSNAVVAMPDSGCAFDYGSTQFQAAAVGAARLDLAAPRSGVADVDNGQDCLEQVLTAYATTQQAETLCPSNSSQGGVPPLRLSEPLHGGMAAGLVLASGKRLRSSAEDQGAHNRTTAARVGDHIWELANAALNQEPSTEPVTGVRNRAAHAPRSLTPNTEPALKNRVPWANGAWTASSTVDGQRVARCCWPSEDAWGFCEEAVPLQWKKLSKGSEWRYRSACSAHDRLPPEMWIMARHLKDGAFKPALCTRRGRLSDFDALKR